MALGSATSVLSPEAFCFLLNLNGGSTDRLEFQLMPDTITESKQANYDTIPIIGRSLPYLGYSHSSSRQISLGLQFVALEREGKYTPEWVKDRVRWLESKVYPRYDGNWVYPPSRLLLVIGKAIGMTVVMSSCSTTWMKPWYQTDNSVLAMRAQVDCAFMEWGYNDDKWGHPFGAEEALAGRNQPYEEGSGAVSFEIPLSV